MFPTNDKNNAADLPKPAAYDYQLLATSRTLVLIGSGVHFLGRW